jgi:hypothetical protein
MIPTMRRSVSTKLLACYALAVIAVPVGVWLAVPHATVEAPVEEARDPDAVAQLAGIWWRYERGLEGDPVRFYYFHGDGKGLYRYGRVGLTNTNSFDYDVEDTHLVLRFRKTGEVHRVPFTVERKDDRDWLVLADDPREPGGARYFREQPGPIDPHEVAPGGHMWIDHKPYATGGAGFALYQFRPAGIDGRGVGWFHRGDFDDWETESLVYRIGDDAIELWFTLRDEHAVTPFTVRNTEPRMLHLGDDPRDFWHPHDYVDIGKSFGQVPLGVQITDVPPVLR